MTFFNLKKHVERENLFDRLDAVIFYADKIQYLLENKPFWASPFLYFTKKKLLKTYFALVNDLKELDLKTLRQEMLYYDSNRLADLTKVAQESYDKNVSISSLDKKILILSNVLQAMGYHPYSEKASS